MAGRKSPRRGMILLIVLGMLALFSLLAVTYVVFSSQSKSASIVLANSEYRGTNNATLMNQVARQIVRGTQDRYSSLRGHSLLDDLYGQTLSSSGTTIQFSNSTIQIGNWASDSLPIRNVQVQNFGNHGLVRFPVRLLNDLDGSNNPTMEEDSCRNRVLTFVDGPLAGMSFRVRRHVTEDSAGNKLVFTPATTDPFFPAFPVGPAANRRAMDHYFYIDIADAGNGIVTLPPGPSGAFSLQVSLSDAISNSAFMQRLFYADPFTDPTVPRAGFRFFLNSSVRSGTGYGRTAAFSGDIDDLNISSVDPTLLPTPVALLNDFTYRQDLPFGGTNESYDAADYNDFFLSFDHDSVSASSDIIPSYHRPEVINYLAGRVDFSNLNSRLVLRLLQLVDYATARPLSLQLRRVNPADIQGWYTPDASGNIVVNPQFASANPGVLQHMTPYLELDFSQSFAQSNTPGSNYYNLTTFLRWLAYGPWDVDTDSDGINDAIWIDPNLPMITSPEGKLLKPLVALKIQDLDGRLNVNTAGSPAHVDPLFYNSQPTTDSFAVSNGSYLPQGFGYGPAEVNLLHMFFFDPLDVASPTFQDYVSRLNSLLSRRYGSRTGNESPIEAGLSTVDFASAFGARERRGRYINGVPVQYSHGSFPSMRLATFGEEAVGIDWNGQPRLKRGTSRDENVNNAYESRLLSEGYADNPYTLEELERVIRVRDRDYSMLPARLEGVLAGETISTSKNLLPSASRNSITTRSVDVTDVDIEHFDDSPESPSHPLRLMVKQLATDRLGADIPDVLFNDLFPAEFRRGMKMDINRPFGDGLDNDNDGQIDEWDEWIVVGAASPYNPLQVEQYFNSDSPPIIPSPLLQYTSNVSWAGLDPGLETKQLFARHLYCLAQLVVPEDYVFVGSPDSSASNPATVAFRARKLAQWAINVVDYRDPDVAMTRFAYDQNPFDGWTPQTGVNLGNVVWGMEQPELLLRESLAFHDFAAKDTAFDDDKQTRMNDATDPDDDADQYKLPKGALYLELYAPRTTGEVDQLIDNNELPGVSVGDIANPNDPYRQGLYKVDNNGKVFLNLAAMSPAPADPIANPYGRQPVWRIAICKRHFESPSPSRDFRQPNRNRNDVTYQLYSGPEAQSNGLFYNVGTKDLAPQHEIQRIIWFTTEAEADPRSYSRIPGLPSTAVAREHIYFNRTGNTRLDGGSYMVLGPSADIRLGSRSPNVAEFYIPSPQRLRLSSSDFVVTKLDNTTVSAATLTGKPITGMVVAALPPSDSEQAWKDVITEYGPSGGVGISISEPLPKPATSPMAQRYYRIPTVNLNTDPASNYHNNPVESWHDFASPGSPYLPDLPFDHEKFQDDANEAMLTQEMLSVGTFNDVSTAFLQRLADPQREYDVALNPYITVDWISIDLTTFSGEDALDGVVPTPSPRPIHFTSRSRSGISGATPNANPIDPNSGCLYTYSDVAPDNAINGNSLIAPLPTQVYFGHQLVRTLGPGIQSSTFGLLNKEFGEPVLHSNAAYSGHPQTPFATHFWMNRQFATPYELMMVPSSHPGQFAQEFTLEQNGADPPSTDPTGKPFGHLLNFFSSTQIDGSGALAGNAGADLVRLLALLETSPPYSDGRKFFHPDTMGANPELARDRAPFNFYSTFRSPGKVNLNTIPSETVWMGVEGNYRIPTDRLPNVTTKFWSNFETKRRGYAPSAGLLASGLPPLGGYVNRLNQDFPTQFAGVFRSPWHSHFGPRLPGGNEFVLRQPPAAATLIRSDVAAPNRHMFYDSSSLQQPNRYPFVNNQPLMRLPNLVTTHSNVFTVRMTMGYFEYRLSDGLGIEYKSEVGRAERSNGFFIIDRSIPVGFYPGIDLNAEKTVLVRRYFE